MIPRYNHHDFVVSYPVNPLRTSRYSEYPSFIQTVKPSTDPNFQRRFHSRPPLDLNLRQASQVHILTPAFLKYSFQYRSTTYANATQNICSLEVLQLKLRRHYASFPCVLHVPPICPYGLDVPTFCEVYTKGLITVQLPSTCYVFLMEPQPAPHSQTPLSMFSLSKDFFCYKACTPTASTTQPPIPWVQGI
jgi:hypothetical protein